MKPGQVIFVFMTAFALSGCAHQTEPDFPAEGFGSSVKQMIRGQIYQTEVRPAQQPVLSIDGEKAEGIMKAYRNSGGNPDTVGEDIAIKMGK